jgi:hypothetical protein
MNAKERIIQWAKDHWGFILEDDDDTSIEDLLEQLVSAVREYDLQQLGGE